MWGFADWQRWWLEQGIERPALHQRRSDQPVGGLGGQGAPRPELCKAHEKIGDQGGDDLQGDGVLAAAEEALQLEVLLDPLKNSSISQRAL